MRLALCRYQVRECQLRNTTLSVTTWEVTGPDRMDRRSSGPNPARASASRPLRALMSTKNLSYGGLPTGARLAGSGSFYQLTSSSKSSLPSIDSVSSIGSGSSGSRALITSHSELALGASRPQSAFRRPISPCYLTTSNSIGFIERARVCEFSDTTRRFGQVHSASSQASLLYTDSPFSGGHLAHRRTPPEMKMAAAAWHANIEARWPSVKAHRGTPLRSLKYPW